MSNSASAIPPRSLTWHKPVPPTEWFRRLAALPESQLPPDDYGDSDATDALLAACRREFGKPNATFVTKGMIAQFAAVRAWTTRRRTAKVFLHRQSHVVHDERGALKQLHPVELVHLGQPDQPIRPDDLPSTATSGVLLIELPLRRAGFALPSWDELVALTQRARRQGLVVHLDGARLWECAPFYQRSVAEIAALADSVYISLYKGLGGLGGAVLLGAEDFLFDCEPWIFRHGGLICHSFPFVLSGLWGLRTNAPQIPRWCARARTLAQKFAAIEGVRLHPAGVTCNAFQLTFAAPALALQDAHRSIGREFGFELFRFILPHPAGSFAEVHLFDAADEVDDAEAVAALAQLLERARHAAVPA